MKTILAIDPSGNFNEGKGTTGWALLSSDKTIISCGQKLAEHYDNKFDYWNSVLDLIRNFKIDYVVIEDFLLYEESSKTQIYSRFETPKLIGLLESLCNEMHIPYILQRAVDVKKRWSDEILVNKNYVQKVNNRYFAGGVMVSEHIRDAIRHGIHFITFKLKETNNG